MTMQFLDALTDDQLALLGCLLALGGTGSLMSLSYYVGKWFRRDKSSARTGDHRQPQDRPTDDHREGISPKRAA